MTQNSLKGSAINYIFTAILLFLLFLIAMEARVFFANKARRFNQILQSDFASYKVKQNKQEKEGDVINSVSSNFSGYDGVPKKSLQTFTNVHEQVEDEALTVESENEEIRQNPLFRGYHAQLGMFSTKDSAEESIKILSLKGILDENYRTYIQAKEIKSKIFYLVEIGIFSTKEDATNFCEKLKRLQIGCIIIK